MNYLSRAKDPAFWATVRESEVYRPLREKYLARWEEECENTPPIGIRFSDWKKFFVTGERIERNYFGARQQMMAAAFLSLIYPEEEKYLSRLEDQIYQITNEYTWAVPAHYRSVLEGTPPKRVIDLFCAETAFALSEILELLGDRLHPFIVRRAREELFERIVKAMDEVEAFGFESMSNNWSSVCAASVAAVYMLEFPELFDKVKPRIDAAMALYLTGYHDDGVCLEGPGYWSYGFGFFTYYADMLYDYTGGKEDLFLLPKVRNIATFMQKTFLTGSTIVSFSDGGRTGSFNVGLLHYLKRRFPDDMVLLRSEFKTGRDGCARFAPALREFIWFDEDMYLYPEESSAEFEFFGEGAGWYIKRCPSYGFAAKGGHNREPHNHLDVGSFIFARDGEQLIVDLGPGAYTKQYFSGERYKTFQASSWSHSVPYFGECTQKPGKEYASTPPVLDGGRLTMDISGAYGIEELKSVKRSFEMLEAGIRLTDSFDYLGDERITERFITLTEPKTLDGAIDLGKCRMEYDPETASPVIKTEELKNGSVCYMIDFELKKGKDIFTILVK